MGRRNAGGPNPALKPSSGDSKGSPDVFLWSGYRYIKINLDKQKSIVILSYENNIDDETIMQPVTVSSKYQVVTPKHIRESMRLRSGQKLMVIVYDGRIELTPERDSSELKGFLKGINTQLLCEDDRL